VWLSQVILLNDWVTANKELKCIQKDVVMALFKVLYRNVPVGTA
jgi:hypothetical protein